MISSFSGEYSWLSNFEKVIIILDDVVYPSVEHAYMSAKNDSIEWKTFCSDSSNSAGKVKIKSRSIQLVDNWENKKLRIMSDCVIQKFSQEPYRSKLISTGSTKIQEGNYWNDTFWGVCLKTNTGQNMLGKFIMNYRQTLIHNQK